MQRHLLGMALLAVTVAAQVLTGVKYTGCDGTHETAAVMNKLAQPSAAVITQTIYSCPPEKTSCPLLAANKIPVPVPVSCPPGGCQPVSVPPTVPAPAPTPTASTACPPQGCAPIFNKLPVVCPPGGCRPCGSGGCPPCTAANCLPVCPEGCIAPPPPVTPVPSPRICTGASCQRTTLTSASAPVSTAPVTTSAVNPPPSPPQPRPVSSRGRRQARAPTVELLTIVGAAIVMLAF